MNSQTIFCVSTANNKLFTDNYRNIFTNKLPQPIANSYYQKICLNSLHFEKTLRTIGKYDKPMFILFTINYDDIIDDLEHFNSNQSLNLIHNYLIHKYEIDVKSESCCKPKSIQCVLSELIKLGRSSVSMFKKPEELEIVVIVQCAPW